MLPKLVQAQQLNSADTVKGLDTDGHNKNASSVQYNQNASAASDFNGMRGSQQMSQTMSTIDDAAASEAATEIGNNKDGKNKRQQNFSITASQFNAM